jgi:hypothetical protein
MAQTIATQRGVVSVASGSSATIFTQSGGLGTRCIFNLMSWFSSPYSDSPKININHLSTSGGSGIIGYYKSGSGVNNGQFFAANNAATGGEFFGSLASMSLVQGIIYGGSTYLGTVTPSNTNFTQPNATTNTVYMPSNYWIGSSDSITVYYTEAQSTATLYLAYSITTITES